MNKGRILHLVIDEKFIDTAYRIFEDTWPGHNEFVCVTDSIDYKYIKKAKVRAISPHKYYQKAFLKSLLRYDVVMLHWMDNTKLWLLEYAHDNVKFAWFGWGGDYYDIITDCSTDENLMLSKTKKLYQQIISNKVKTNGEKQNGDLLSILKSSRVWIRRFKGLLFRKKSKVVIMSEKLIKTKKNLLQRVNYFIPVIPDDYQLLKTAFPEFNAKYLSWSYGSLEDDIITDKMLHAEISGDNILLGNSDTETNNHLEAYDMLLNADMGERNIIVPLNYGHAEYADAISMAGKTLFGNRFIPIRDFMPITQYIEMIRTCSVAVMNHLRQQACGTIIIMLYLGAKVFLREENPVYSFFKREGAVIFPMLALPNEISLRLHTSEIAINRSVLQTIWGADVIQKKTIALIETVTDKKLC